MTGSPATAGGCPAISSAAHARRWQIWPALSPKLRFSATYHDAWISHPERLGVELLLDTQRLAPDSVALNYAELRPPAGSASPMRRTDDRERCRSTARAIVNATGAWLDESLALLAGRQRQREPFVSGTKGSHLILDHPELHDALGGHMIFFEHDDGRVCIVFPYLGKVLVGSTDIRVERASRVRCEPEERDYILDALRGVFPGIAVGPEHVVFSYSGIRPLPRSDHEFTGRISRGHFVHRIDGAVPQFCMVGGKWTTFRAFAEQTADAVLAELGQRGCQARLRCRSAAAPAFPQSPGALASRHWSDAMASTPLRAVAPRRCLRDPRRGGAGLLPRARRRPAARTDVGPATGAEIAFLARHEFVLGLGDVLLRRTPLSIRGRRFRRARASVSRRSWRPNWAGTRKDQASEIETFTADLADYHGVSREMLDRRDKERSMTMRISTKARMNRLFTNGGCLDVALDHGVCNEPSFLVGLEDMAGVVDTLVARRSRTRSRWPMARRTCCRAVPKRTSRRWSCASTWAIPTTPSATG